MAGTQFSAIYNRFLGKITDDMYLELTPQDTLEDLQRLLIDAIPGFEFPRHDLFNYVIDVQIIPEDEITDDDFVVKDVLWHELGEDLSELEHKVEWKDVGDGYDEDGWDHSGEQTVPSFIVDKSYFIADLTSEEINILACLMKQGWVQRQVTSIEVTRMKYSGADFKMTSQANHLQKLLTLLEESRRDQFHMQRLYKRRKFDDSGNYISNWSVLNHHGHSRKYVD